MNRIYKYLLAIAALAAVGFGIYEYTAPDKYQYWKELIAKDPKPDGVSEQEYREKLRAGYCWRDRKFYTPAELHRKAMVSFAGRLLGETEAYKANMTTNQGGRDYSTGADCVRHEKACSVWFVPQDYTNEQWDRMFLAEKDPTDGALLAKYLKYEIKQQDDLKKYLEQYNVKGFSLIIRGYNQGGASIYGSDCCKVLSIKEAAPIIKNNTLITYLEGAATFPESEIPKNIDIENYGVGNFYFSYSEVSPGFHQWDENKEKTYQIDFSDMLFMNNCGDVLWQPHYIY